MKIAIVSAFEESVPPPKYGGTELVVYNLTEELVKLGHDVTLLATGDSETTARLIPIFQHPIRTIEAARDLKVRDAFKYIGTGKALEYLRDNNFDIIHQHQTWRFLPFTRFLDSPVLSTLHGPLDVLHQKVIYETYKDLPYVSISLNQRLPMARLNFVANVYNGIDISQFTFSAVPQDYYVFLGRMSKEKGPVQAIQIAKAAGVRLIMAAKVDVVDKDYFEQEVKPLIDREQIQFIGEVDHPQKVKLLSNAKALLAPIQWEEPFGLYFIEAMVCGTPVVTLHRGSAPEIILDGKTGFVCQTLEEAAAKLKDVSIINREDCHNHVKHNFSAKIMTERYIAVYQAIVNTR